jgi:hypothetical protein
MRRPSPPVRLLLLAGLLGLQAGLHTNAQAQNSPYTLGASQTFTHDSNLLRLSDGQAAPAGFSRSDTVATTALIGGFDQAIGRQRVYGNATLRANRLSRNKIYDNEGFALAAGLDWSTVNRLSGNLNASANRSLGTLNSEEIGLVTRKNLETIEQLNAGFRLGLVTQYTAELNLGHRRVRNSLDQRSVQARDYEQDSASLGLRWQPSNLTRLGVALRLTQGSFPKFDVGANGSFIEDSFERQDIDLTARYQPTGLSAFDLRISLGDTRYDRSSQRDFSGVTGAFSWTWQATGKLRFITRLNRDTGQESYAVQIFNVVGTSDYSRVNTTLAVQTDYQVSAKIALTANLLGFDRELVRTLPPNLLFPTDVRGTERGHVLSLGVRWAPRRSTLLGCDASVDRRNGSGQLAADLQADRFGCYAQFSLQ